MFLPTCLIIDKTWLQSAVIWKHKYKVGHPSLDGGSNALKKNFWWGCDEEDERNRCSAKPYDCSIAVQLQRVTDRRLRAVAKTLWAAWWDMTYGPLHTPCKPTPVCFLEAAQAAGALLQTTALTGGATWPASAHASNHAVSVSEPNSHLRWRFALP